MEQVTKSRLRMTALTLLAVAVIGGVIWGVLSDDERPIRVRNGSMEILAARDSANSWGWVLEPNGDIQDPTPSYSHEPRNAYIDREINLWVKVVLRQGTCAQGDRASGRLVRVEFSENNFFVMFKRGRSGKINYRTKVRPSGSLTPVPGPTPPEVLRYGTQGSGFVSGVRVNNWFCAIPNANALDTIYICSAENQTECQ
jgi:hypothetical protein